jgi:hypothetical protein
MATVMAPAQQPKLPFKAVPHGAESRALKKL